MMFSVVGAPFLRVEEQGPLFPVPRTLWGACGRTGRSLDSGNRGSNGIKVRPVQAFGPAHARRPHGPRGRPSMPHRADRNQVVYPPPGRADSRNSETVLLIKPWYLVAGRRFSNIPAAPAGLQGGGWSQREGCPPARLCCAQLPRVTLPSCFRPVCSCSGCVRVVEHEAPWTPAAACVGQRSGRFVFIVLQSLTLGRPPFLMVRL